MNQETAKQLTLGILAHVDAGKTTLSESLLCQCGVLKKAGRVDKGDAFLDSYALEKERGITIFSKQAVLPYRDLRITLLDTPGHVDFSAEMERTLQVVDGAVLVISGSDGIQSHTRTLWRLLERYDIPVLLFINKMDQGVADKTTLMSELKESLSGGCVDFSDEEAQGERKTEFLENIAMCEEEALNRFLETGEISGEERRRLVAERKLFPCYFGSALKQEGVRGLLEGVYRYLGQPSYGPEFGARVYKIGRDGQGNRLTYLKLTGGSLAVKETLVFSLPEGEAREKINQIRLYSGAKYEVLSELRAGMTAAVTGPEKTFAGQGLGAERENRLPILEPVLSYQMYLPKGSDLIGCLPSLRQLAEEEPQMRIELPGMEEEEKGSYGKNREIRVKLMGEIQIQVLKRLIEERFGLEVAFGPGSIVYKETIASPVEGVGHFEPLRHYAEVHLLLEPGEPGSGLQFSSRCSEDVLDRNWQRLVLTHLQEKAHKGVLTGSVITDMRITLMTGKAHLKHTEGGDFRQATYRAVRQGLMQAESVLLEPYYDFVLEIPDSMTGRAMTDLERMHALSFQPEMEGGRTVLRGSAPVSCMQAYQKEVLAYTKGQGNLSCIVKGYAPCHNQEEVLAQRGYDPERDLYNPSSSVFCSHGAGVIIPWDQVREHMHLPSIFSKRHVPTDAEIRQRARRERESAADTVIGTEEIDAILERTFYANSRNGCSSYRGLSGEGGQGKRAYPAQAGEYVYQPRPRQKEYLLVDGYNVIYAWDELKELARVNLDSARGRLLDVLSNYQGVRGCELIVVFDAYLVEGHREEILEYHNIHVVFTRQAETADQYIEKFAHENARKYQVTVATSDGLEQIIIRGEGCSLISARELEGEIRRVGETLLKNYQERQETGRIFLGESFPEPERPE